MYYHYTTLETFLKILQGIKIENGEPMLHLRATHIDRVNDPTEMIICQDKLVEVIKSYEESNNIDANLRIAKIIEKLSPSKFKELCKVEKNEHTPYVICFSNNADHLPMWSLYGDKHHGVCLSFSDDLVSLLKLYNPTPIILSGNVEYNDYSLSKAIENSLDLYFRYFSNSETLEIEDEISELLLEISPFIKDKNYEVENEFRVCIYNYNKINNKELGECTIYNNNDDYINIYLPVSSLKKVRLGNRVPFDITSEILGLFFKDRKFKIEIEHSNIPFR